MKRQDYENYLARFNAKDYRGVLEFWSESFDVKFAGVVLRKPEDLLKFYGFFHSYVNEAISVLDFVSDGNVVALRADVRIQGLRDLGKETLDSAGYGGLYPIEAGQVVHIPQLIMYQLEAGKFKKVHCGII